MKVYVTNNEDRIVQQQRNIEYSLKKPLPKDWDDMTINRQGIWLNNNAIFLKDSFEEPHYDEINDEETTEIEFGRQS